MDTDEIKQFKESLTDEQKAELVGLGIQVAQSVIEEDGKIRFFRFFAEMVYLFGDSIRPFVKILYLGAAAEVSKDVFEEMDDAETVRGYSENTVFGEFMYEKMLHITFPSFGRVYPDIGFSVTEKEYQEHPEAYEHISEPMIARIMWKNGIDERLEKKFGRTYPELAYNIWAEYLNNGVEKTVIEEWDEDEYEDEVYFQNLPKDEYDDELENRRDELINTFSQILRKDRTLHED